jgi:hypothetical protein
MDDAADDGAALPQQQIVAPGAAGAAAAAGAARAEPGRAEMTEVDDDGHVESSAPHQRPAPKRPPTATPTQRTRGAAPKAAAHNAQKPKPKPKARISNSKISKPKQRGPSKKRTGGVAKTAPRNPQSGHPFVTWYPRRRAWRAQVGHNSKLTLVGMFKPAEDTDEARADAATRAAVAVAKHLGTIGRGGEASVDAAGRPRQAQRSANFSSRFVGVSRDERVEDGWKAQLSVGGKAVWTGYFTGPTGEEDAARAFDKEVRRRGLFRPTNFPE